MGAIALQSNSALRKHSAEVMDHPPQIYAYRPLQSLSERITSTFYLRKGSPDEREAFENLLVDRFNFDISDAGLSRLSEFARRQRIEARRSVVPVLAFMFFCTGWTGVRAFEAGWPVKFQQSVNGLVSEDCLCELDPLEMRDAGQRAYELLMAD